MFTAKIENSSGDMLTLTGNEPVYQVIKITGLNPPQAQINTTSIVGLDGARFNSAKLNTRNIVLTVKINGDVEANRLNLYRYFRTKEPCTFYYANGTLDVTINGYVENVECDLFTNNELAQISILCPYPYFKSIFQVIADSSNALGLFVFPFSINATDPIAFSSLQTSADIEVYNASESETGATIEINVLDSVSAIQLNNVVTGDTFSLSYNFIAGDKIVINTNKGQKSITLIRNGVLTNIFSALQQGSTFFQLVAGMNLFEFTANGVAASDDISILFRYYNEYRGV